MDVVGIANHVTIHGHTTEHDGRLCNLMKVTHEYAIYSVCAIVQ